MKIDNLNIDIVRELKDGRKLFKKIADKFGVTENTVRAIVNRLKEEGGVEHFAMTIREIKKKLHCKTRVEVLIPDFKGSSAALKTVLDAGPDVLNHNIETIPSLYSKARSQADY